ncbi:unnamed protein product [Phyllotreta striolata]|uniref:K Homology domain-containing protein n=1 Tax=Phyllotreta striolata TaxID=444603 RepID=A0A9N9TIV0_PHYSR|nr:unnamed protein product [Phyllotreta striolata]
MCEKYDSNGEYYDDNFKRKSNFQTKIEDGNSNTETAGENDDGSGSKTGEYIKELLAEKILIDQGRLPNATRLLEQEVAKVQAVGRVPIKENKYVDIYREKPIKVTVKVLVPVKEHPKFNFVGKLLGPKGNSMKRLQEETMCKMAVLGRGSMRDKNKEEELRNSLDPKYSHLTDDLHVEISALGPPAEAHARVAYALAEVRKYLIPDSNDHIRLEQMREMESEREVGEEREPKIRRPPPSIPRPPPPASMSHGPPPPSVLRTATRAPMSTPRVMPAKTKIMSILDRARVAMEESYGYDEEYYNSSPSYEYSSRNPYTSYHDDYDVDYYKGSSSYVVYFSSPIIIIFYSNNACRWIFPVHFLVLIVELHRKLRHNLFGQITYFYSNRRYQNHPRQNRPHSSKNNSNWKSSPSKKLG